MPPLLKMTRDVPAIAASDQTFKFIDECLQLCLRPHPRCNSSLAKLLPSRLLFTGDCPDRIRLVEPGSTDLDLRYVALSYSWEGANLCITTLATLASRKHHIPWEELPAVFRDTILVANWFKIQYIWIDSLCIIQDSKTGWEIQSSYMAHVYENAHFTIAAASSPSPNISFLNFIRDYSASVSLDTALYSTNPKQTTLKARRSTNSFCKVRRGEGPLSKRGWVCQEVVLSRRIVQYTSAEVYYH